MLRHCKRKRKRSDSVLWQMPPHQQKCQKGKVTTQTTPQKSSIKQRLRTDLGQFSLKYNARVQPFLLVIWKKFAYRILLLTCILEYLMFVVYVAWLQEHNFMPTSGKQTILSLSIFKILEIVLNKMISFSTILPTTSSLLNKVAHCQSITSWCYHQYEVE